MQTGATRRRTRPTPTHGPRALVLLVVIFGWGTTLARGQSVSPPGSGESRAQSAMQTFVIIFRQGPRVLTEAEKARRQQEVSAWARTQNAAGHQLEPRILGPAVVRPAAGAESESGTETHDNAWPVTALLFLQARDLAEAGSVAASHPAVNYGVTIEVRPWAPPLVPLAATSPTSANVR